MSIVVPRDGSMATASYHPETRDPVSYAPNFVRSVGDGRAEVAIIDFQTSELVDQGRPVPRGVPKVGRNKPCPCGSGKKYKKCHGGMAGYPGPRFTVVLGDSGDDESSTRKGRGRRRRLRAARRRRGGSILATRGPSGPHTRRTGATGSAWDGNVPG
jgi:hypothetical protein